MAFSKAAVLLLSGVQAVQHNRNPGAGMTPSAITPYATTMKDGFSMVTCAKDEMLLNADKHGDGKFSYTMGSVSNVSIVHYTEMIAKEDLKTMTIEVCYGFCRTIQEMEFFGITNGRDCYCTPYFKQIAGDSSDCDAPCDGDPTTMCGGKSKSNIFEMHHCGNTAEDLATADSLADTSLVALSAVEADVAAAGASMQENGAKLQEAFGQVGDPVAAGNCQKAKESAGDVVHAAEAGAAAAETLTALRAKAAGGALDTIEATEELTVSISTATEAADAQKLALTKIAKTAIAPQCSSATQCFQTSIQYYPVMYFVDKDFVDMPSTCGGDLAADPLVGNHGNCAAACDNVVGECVGYSYMADGASGLCFLFSKFTSVTYYTGAKGAGFLQRKMPLKGEMPSKDVMRETTAADFDLSAIEYVDKATNKNLMNFPKIGVVDGQEVDMQLGPAPGGDAFVNNGKVTDGGFGSVNCKANKNSQFVANFYKSGTTEPITISELAVTFYDIDSGKGPEKVTVSGIKGHELGEGHDEYYEAEASGDSLTVTSVKYGSKSQNPVATGSLTPEQKGLSFTVLFKDASSFLFDFDLTGMPDTAKGRNVLFSLKQEIMDPTCQELGARPTQQQCTVTFYYHNLAGNDDRDITKDFTAYFSGTTPLHYNVKYANEGGSNTQGGPHTFKQTVLEFTDAVSTSHEITLVSNSGAAHVVTHLRFSPSCPFLPAIPEAEQQAEMKAAVKTLYSHGSEDGVPGFNGVTISGAAGCQKYANDIRSGNNHENGNSATWLPSVSLPPTSLLKITFKYNVGYGCHGTPDGPSFQFTIGGQNVGEVQGPFTDYPHDACSGAGCSTCYSSLHQISVESDAALNGPLVTVFTNNARNMHLQIVKIEQIDKEDYVPPTSDYAGEYQVWYNGGQRNTNFIVGCDNTATQPNIFVDRLHLENVAAKCTESRDSAATMYIENTHGTGKYECLSVDGSTIKGSHYTGPNAYWGTIEYKRITKEDCSPVNFDLVHKGHCAGGFIAPNLVLPDITSCVLACNEHPQCGYISFRNNGERSDGAALNCALYTAAAKCPDDDNYPEYNSYSISRQALMLRQMRRTIKKKIAKTKGTRRMQASPLTVIEREEFGEFAYYLQKATYNCATGFTTTGKADGATAVLSVCSSEGEMNFIGITTEAPQCQKVQCGEAPVIENASLSGDKDTVSAVYGDKVEYACNTGYAVSRTMSPTGKLTPKGDEPLDLVFEIECLGTGLYSDAAHCLNIDDCVGHSCGPHGTCVDGINDYDCNCADGFEQTMLAPSAAAAAKSEGADCSVMGYCSSGMSLTSTRNPCPRYDYNAGNWQETCGCLDTLIFPTGCTIEVTNGADGAGDKWIYEKSAMVNVPGGPGYDRIRSINIKTQKAKVVGDQPDQKYCGNVDDCGADACGVYGTCIDLVNDYECDCQVGYDSVDQGDNKMCEAKKCPAIAPVKDSSLESPGQLPGCTANDKFTIDTATPTLSSTTGMTDKIVYANIGAVSGQAIDLIVATAPGMSWTENSPGSSGIVGAGMGKINAKSKDLSSLVFTFVKSQTTTEIVVPSIAMSLYDIDSSSKGPEKYEIKGYTHYTKPSNWNEYQQIDTDEPGHLVVESTSVGTSGDRPTTADAEFSDEQIGRSLTFYFTGVSSFSLDADLTGISGKGAGGRNVYFSLEEVVKRDDCPQAEQQTMSYPDTLRVECTEGHSVDGTATVESRGFVITCQSDGSLTPVSQCLPMECGMAPAVPGADPQFDISNEFIYGQKAKFSCPEGQTFNGQASGPMSIDLECGATGAFPAVSMECKPVTCGPAPPIAHASLSSHEVKFPNVASYQCDLGYSFVAESPEEKSFDRACQPDGSYAPAPSAYAEEEEVSCSATTCETFGWSDALKIGCGNLVGGTGVPGTCGASQSSIDSWGCIGQKTWEDANSFCQANGARLCTQSEMIAQEGIGGGCSVSSKPAWTSTPCSGSGHWMVTASDCGRSPTAQCSSNQIEEGIEDGCELYKQKYCAASSSTNLPVVHGGAGGEIGRSWGVTSRTTCSHLCQQTAGCTHYSFTKNNNGDCLLYDMCPAGHQYGNGAVGTKTYSLETCGAQAEAGRCCADLSDSCQGGKRPIATVPTCKPVTCGTHPDVQGATNDATGSAAVFRDVVHYSCEAGKTIDGTSTGLTEWSITCEATGAFSNAVATSCQLITFKVTGRVTDATNLVAVSGATIKITANGVTVEQLTDSNGHFEADGVPQGEVAMTAEKSGTYIKSEKLVSVTRNVMSGQSADLSLSPVLPPSGWRVVLQWDAQPRDLDSHLYFGSGGACHVYYANRRVTCSNGIHASLDVDDVNGNGPETITISNMCTSSSCTVKYMIYKYSGSGDFSSGNAVARIFNGDSEVGSYKAAAGAGAVSGRWWAVAKIDGSSGSVTECVDTNCGSR